MAPPYSGAARARRQRRTWLRDEQDWIIEPVTKENVFGRTRDIEGIIVHGVREARRRLIAGAQMNRPVVRSIHSVSRSCSPFSVG